MKPKLFGSSGIRGLANVEVTAELAQRVGAALAAVHGEEAAVVGRDARLTGPMLEAALLSGLASGGVDAIDVGLAPTPVVAWMTAEARAGSGVAVTASHNPPEYNGLKVFNGRGMSLTNAEQLELEDILEREAYRPAQWDEVGSSEELDASEPYVEALADCLGELGDARVGCDLFCGATCVTAPLAFRETGVEAEFINGVPDGSFPAGNPEPTAESLRRLGDYVKDRGLDLGFGFDGDGDRMMVVDAGGAAVSPDRVMAAYAGYVVEREGGGVVVTHVGASMSVDDMVREAGGTVVRTPVGDAFITEAVERHRAVFGGEPVGAWVTPEAHMCPDGVLSALKLMEALEETSLGLREFAGRAPEYPLEQAKVECPNARKQPAMKRVADGYRGVFGEVKGVSTVDGVRLDLGDGWVLIRPSGTEPLMRLTAEGRDAGTARALMEKGKTLVRQMLGGSS
jgi:phosphoglucosamine mutase